jgi:hypothetical protein
MAYFMVYELQEEHVLDPGGYIGPPPAEAYHKRLNPVCIGFYNVEDATAACVKAAQETRRLGYYVAMEGFPMSIDFTAKVAELNGGNDDATE